MNYVDVGFLNFVSVDKIITVNRPDSSPIKRLIQHAKEEGRYVDLTQGRKTRSILVVDNGDQYLVVSSTAQTSTIISRMNKIKSNNRIVEHKIHDDEVIETTVGEGTILV